MAANFSNRIVATLQNIRFQVNEHESGTTNIHGIADTSLLATKEYADNAASAIIDGAPAALNTLNELAAALNDDSNFATTITNSLALKAPLASPTFTGTVDFSSATVTGLDISATAYQANAPSSPSIGDLWVESDVDSTTITAGSIIQYQSTAPSSPVTGRMWFDTTVNTLKVYQGSTWNPVGAQNNGYPYVYNTNGINSNWTIPAGYNAMSAGPITIADGVTVTISNGSSWAVV